jgi:hypothetical protein
MKKTHMFLCFYVFRNAPILWKVLDPIHRHKMQKHSFAHTFCTKIKHGRLKKGGASTANPKKEHHHGGAVCHGILARHPRCHRHCPLCCRCRCSPANLVTVSIALPPSPSLLLATLITTTPL